MTDESVRVAVRIRPLVKSECERGCQFALDQPQTNQLYMKESGKAFTFNHVFGPDVNDGTVYQTTVQDMVSSAFKGYNVTVLAYGQTGSGKTYTMGTNYTGDSTAGVIPRAVHEIFEKINNTPDWTYKVTVSFMELYNEQLYDLLTTKSRKECIVDIREDSKNIKIIGLTENEVSTADEALSSLVEGSNRRATGTTAMNEFSSRSHAIFTLKIYQQQRDNPNSATISKFHLVDLAGSERVKKTGATGSRFKEGVSINQELLALGNVISQLSGAPNSYVAYRDSKLTRLLRDSLGGNSLTLLIACISPADYNADETLSTLRYADRAKKIKNKPIVNQDPRAAEINRLNEIIKDLRSAAFTQGGVFSCPTEHAELAEKNKSLQKKLRELTEQFNENILESMCVNERAELAEKAKEQLHGDLTKILEDFEVLLKTDELADDQHHSLMIIYRKIVELLKTHENMEVQLQLQSNSLQPPAHALSPSNSMESLLQVSISETSQLDEEVTEHTLRQADRNKEIQSINRAVALKEELLTKLRENMSQLENDKLHVMEEEIKALQAEKEQLVKTLESVATNNTSGKVQALAESRRKKVQELEKKIGELTRKCTEQNRVLKAKEKSDQKITNLMQEIQKMKHTRVQLVRQMRKESENFARWKLLRERELYKLKDQDRKRQNEIVRLQTQHNKQQNVYKRKMEEAWAVNKRLKEAMEKRVAIQNRRDKESNNTKDSNINAWVDQEMMLLLSTVAAECTLEKLMKDRASLVEQLNELKAKNIQEPSNNVQTQINDFANYIEVRSEQINELQQKIKESDQKNRASSRLQAITSMNESKAALTHVFKISAENEKKYIIQYDELMEKYDQALTDLRILQLKEQGRFENEHKDLLKEKDEIIAKLQAQLQEQQQQQKKKRTIQSIHDESVFEYNLDMSEDSFLDVDDPNDPDYRNTPMHKRFRSSNNNSATSADNSSRRTQSSSDSYRCQCRTSCTTRLCTCRKNNSICSANTCGCDPVKCNNKDKENIQQKFFPDITVTKTVE